MLPTLFTFLLLFIIQVEGKLFFLKVCLIGKFSIQKFVSFKIILLLFFHVHLKIASLLTLNIDILENNVFLIFLTF